MATARLPNVLPAQKLNAGQGARLRMKNGPKIERGCWNTSEFCDVGTQSGKKGSASQAKAEGIVGNRLQVLAVLAILWVMPKQSTTESQMVHMLIDKPLLKRLDDFRFNGRFESRNEAARWLMKWALDRNAKPEKAGRSEGGNRA
jgi:hypothetical protein